jgi:hypothetical protein
VPGRPGQDEIKSIYVDLPAQIILDQNLFENIIIIMIVIVIIIIIIYYITIILILMII